MKPERKLRDLIPAARSEAQLRRDPMIGTEHLLLALMHDGRLCADYLQHRSARDGRDALAALDAEALRAAGVEPPERPIPRGAATTRLSFTVGARRAVGRGARIARAHGSRRIASRDLLVALLTDAVPSTAADVLRGVGLEPADVLISLQIGRRD